MWINEWHGIKRSVGKISLETKHSKQSRLFFKYIHLTSLQWKFAYSINNPKHKPEFNLSVHMLEFIIVMFSRTACCSTRCYRFMAADPEWRRGNQLIKTWRSNESFFAEQFTARYHGSRGSSTDTYKQVSANALMRVHERLSSDWRLVYTSVATCAPHEILMCFWRHKTAL